jgi:hypothetical protein
MSIGLKQTGELSAPQTVWLELLVGKTKPGKGDPEPVADVADSWEKNEERKSAKLQAARDQLESQKEEINRLMDVEFKTQDGKKIRMKDVKRDPKKEFDLGHHLKKLAIPGWEPGKELTEKQKKIQEEVDANLKNVMEAQRKLVKLVSELQEAPADPAIESLPEKEKRERLEARGNRESAKSPEKLKDFLFSDKELRDEFYSPLVREGIIPENAVIDRYSEFKVGFDAATALYDEKSKDIKKSEVYKHQAEVLTKIAKAFVSGAASATGGIGHAAHAPEAMEHITNAVKVISDASATVVLGGLAGFKNGVDDIVDNIGNILSTIVCQISPALGSDVYNIYTGITKTAMAGVHLGVAASTGDIDELQKMFQCLASGYVTTFGELASRSQLNDTDKKEFSEFGTTLLSLFTTKVSAKTAYDTFKKGCATGDWSGFVNQVTEACKTATACIQSHNFAEGGKEYKEDKEKLYEEAVKEKQEEKLKEEWEKEKFDAWKEEKEQQWEREHPGKEESGSSLSKEKEEFEKNLKEQWETKKEELLKDAPGSSFADWEKKEKEDREKELKEEWKQNKQELLKENKDLTFEEWKEEQEKPEGMPSKDDFDPDKYYKDKTGNFAYQEYNKGVVETAELQEKFKTLLETTNDEGKKEKLIAGARSKSQEILNLNVSKERKRYRALLAMGYDASEDDQAEGEAEEELDEFIGAHSIDDLIRQAQTDGLLLQMVNTLTQGGMVMVGQFVPACKAVQAGMVFLEKVISAGTRVLELIEWSENIDDAQVAGSPVHAALLKHAHEMKKQIGRDTILAILALAETAGAGAACSGIDAGIGHAVQKTAAAAAAATEVAYEGITELELEAAWKTYKKALRNPDDRIQARRALQRNPSLALYCVSYHAKAKDPIALNIMQQLGANEVTIDDADPHKVVTFLEAKFSEDPKLYRSRSAKLKEDKNVKWLPQGGEPLSLKNWMSAKAKSGLDDKPSTAAIDGGMIRVAKAAEAYKKAKALEA